MDMLHGHWSKAFESSTNQQCMFVLLVGCCWQIVGWTSLGNWNRFCWISKQNLSLCYVLILWEDVGILSFASLIVFREFGSAQNATLRIGHRIDATSMYVSLHLVVSVLKGKLVSGWRLSHPFEKICLSDLVEPLIVHTWTLKLMGVGVPKWQRLQGS